MGCIAVYTKIKLPIFSIKSPEAFQVGSALPIPQPSSLIGSLAYALAVAEGLGSESALAKARNITLTVGTCIDKLIVPSTVILRRFRVLDRGFERPKEKGAKITEYDKLMKFLKEKDYYLAKLHLERSLTDALYREYMFSISITCLWVFKEKIDVDILKLISRLGDTESYANVVKVWEDECKLVRKKIIETKFPAPMVREKIESMEGKYIVMRMCDKDRSLKWFIIPLAREIKRTAKGLKYFTYKPYRITISFKEEVTIAKTSTDEIFLGE